MRRKAILFAAALFTVANTMGQHIEVAYDKTVHMVFPSRILYFDLGSEAVMASIVEEKPNILRIKAAERDFKGETNISVVMEDEDIRSFDISYSDSLVTSVYRIGEVQQQANEGEDIGERIYRENRNRITSIGSTRHGVSLTLKSLYCNDGFIYMHIEVANRSYIPFMTEAIVISTDRTRNIRKGQPAGVELVAEKSFGKPDEKGNYRIVICLRSFTFRDDETLRVQIFERGGSRHTGFDLDNRTFKRIMEEL